MKKLLAIIICKIVYFIGGLVGKGSSYPGKMALKICPNILSLIQYPKVVIAITGSNGKTSTTEMVAAVLKRAGKSVAYNEKGSNQIEGVTTTVLHYASLGGVMKQDVLLLESDERYAKYSFRYFHPTHYVVTNLYRDQLTRNAHPEWVFEDIQRSIHGSECLILNADDPQVSRFGYQRDNVVWFGLGRTCQDTTSFVGRYNDGRYCPICHAPMEYEYYHYNHIGNYHCSKCDFKRQAAEFEVTEVNLNEGRIKINNKDEIRLAFKSIYNVYNILATYSVCSKIGIDGGLTAAVLSDYILKNGRFVQFKLGPHKGTFLVSKHENSISYDMSLGYAAGSEEACTVVVIVDAISRKYFTSEISWLWDVNFEQLNTDNVRRIFLCGRYAHDLMLRFEATDISRERISVYEDIDRACEYLKDSGDEAIYTITCFSDRMKFLSNVEIV